MKKMLLLVQPFGLGSPGGGSRILRALLKDAPTSWISLAATSEPIPTSPFGEELQERGRPHFGRFERTRFAGWFKHLDGWTASRLEDKLNAIIKQKDVTAVHGIAHACWDTLAAFKVARHNRLPFYLTIHDDPAYCLRGHANKEKLLAGVANCWTAAAARFVICEDMGEELCRRWGKKDYVLVTDGIEEVARQPRPSTPNRFSIYFMGLLHNTYEPNFVALQKALRLVSEQQPGLKVRLIMRCGSIRKEAVVYPELLQVLPFASEAQVQLDMEDADILYQPLSLDPEDWSMNAYSLSTKMITYLGAGLPILFHGPADSAAGKLLAKNRAAFVCATNESMSLAETLKQAMTSQRDSVTSSALNLATQHFQLDQIRKNFWNAIATC